MNKNLDQYASPQEIDRKPDSMSLIEWMEYLEKQRKNIVDNNIPPPSMAVVYNGRKSGVFPTDFVTWWTRDINLAKNYSSGGTYGQIKSALNNPTVFEVEITPKKTLDFVKFSTDTPWVERRTKLIEAGVNENKLNEWFGDSTVNYLGANVGLFDPEGENFSATKLINELRLLGYDSVRINEGNIVGYVILDQSIVKITSTIPADKIKD